MGGIIKPFHRCFRLSVWTLLNVDAANGFTALFALVCRSFSSMNLGTSKRSPTTPEGDQNLPHVVEGNLLLARTVLLVFLVVALKGCWLLEQPGGSVAHWHPRFEQLVASALKIYETRWWARHYGSLTPFLDNVSGRLCFCLEGETFRAKLLRLLPRKRHKAWSNTVVVKWLNRGILTKAQRESCVVTTVNKKKVGNKVSYSGNKHLKKTQSYPIAFGLKILRLLPHFFPADVVEIDGAGEAPLVFHMQPWGDCWCEAKVLEACVYMRGSIHLATSARWKSVFPTHHPFS